MLLHLLHLITSDITHLPKNARAQCTEEVHAPPQAAQTVTAQRVRGGARNALLQQERNETKRLPQSEVCAQRDGAIGTVAKTWGRHFYCTKTP